MEIGQIATFVAICDAGTFTAAARARHIGQSAVSASIASLEREVGARLFERTRTCALLTAEGQALLPYARRMLQLEREAYGAVGAALGKVAGEVKVGILARSGRLDLASVVTGLRRTHPAVSVSLLQSMTGSTGHLELVQSGDLDLALVANPGPVPHGVQLEPLLSEPIVAVLPADDPCARRPRLRVDELCDRTYLALPSGWGARAVVDEALRPRSRPVVEASDYTLLCDLVAGGVGVAFVPEYGAVVRDDVVTVRTELSWRLLLALPHAETLPAADSVVAAAIRAAAAAVDSDRTTD